MEHFVSRLTALAFSLGAAGLFVVTFLDSSFLSLPEIADLLIVWMITHHKSRMPLYVASAVVGSMIGSLLMYYVGRKGGQALVRKRIAGRTVERTLAAIERHGMLSLVVAALLPPPSPLKAFVLLAGAAGVSVPRFLTAIGTGRTIRYLGLGVLAITYGDRAMAYVHENKATVAVAGIVVLLLGAAAYLWWAKRDPVRTDNPVS
jgi:membrane protein DedA with SNARE-associated domain